ncbi:MAG: LPXTG cell wall anchor domain-containing protein [Bacillus sp. (in: Bacteria)]|nr:LPXTG cell wall anchor domain-containing protein [Bacillus sp. (in: firmicutes)]
MGGDESDVFSTAQGFQGIVAYQLFLDGKSSLYDLSQPLEREGARLPETATSFYTILALGLLMAALGTGYYLAARNRKIIA